MKRKPRPGFPKSTEVMVKCVRCGEVFHTRAKRAVCPACVFDDDVKALHERLTKAIEQARRSREWQRRRVAKAVKR